MQSDIRATKREFRSRKLSFFPLSLKNVLLYPKNTQGKEMSGDQFIQYWNLLLKN